YWRLGCLSAQTSVGRMSAMFPRIIPPFSAVMSHARPLAPQGLTVLNYPLITNFGRSLLFSGILVQSSGFSTAVPVRVASSMVTLMDAN
ncbi:hypothetical protein HDU67_006213, partial [Dinochytrium kinnereticum]